MINQYSRAIGNSLEQYVPLPLDQMYKVGEAIQKRGDAAESINDQFQSGLASLEALAPAQKAYVQNYANQYRDAQTKLLEQYQGNSSDPEYARKSRQLISKFATDPNLKIIQETNQLYKQKRDLATQLQANGKKYIDSNPTFNGKDENGNLISNVGQLQGTNFDDSILKKFQIQGERMEQHGAMKTSAANVQRQQAQYLNALNGKVYDEDINQGLQYFTQQGLSLPQARNAMKQLIASGSDYIKSDLDTGYLNWQESRAARLAQQQPTAPVFDLQHYSKPLVPGGTADNVTLRSATGNTVESLLRNLDDKGNLKQGARTVDDTPENRKAFAGKYVRYNEVDPDALGTEGGTTSKLQVSSGYNPQEQSLVATARQLTNMPKASAKDVLTKYKSLITGFDQTSQQLVNSNNTKLQDQLASTIKRQIGTGEVYKVNKGKLEIVTDSKELAKLDEVKADNISGISSKAMSDGKTTLNGYAQFSKDGNIYYTRTPQDWQKNFSGSNTVSQYLQDFDPKNLNPIDLGNNTKVFTNPNQAPIPYVFKGNAGILTPYKGNRGGSLVGGAIFTPIDKNGNPTNQSYTIPLSELEDNEVTSIFARSLNTNK